MSEFDTNPQPITCPNCKGPIMVKLSDFKKDNVITCPHCSFQMKVDDDYHEHVQKSLGDFKKSIANINKKLR
jgi:DNA-directed RNA polymerase subunit RPC12/RpoP